MKPKVQEILEHLVSFPVYGGSSNMIIIDWIKAYLEKHGVSYHLVPNDDGTKASIHCRIGPASDGGVILSGHTDVVPVEGQAWTSDPFQLTDKGDGKLYGRGSCDMKGFIACCLACLPEMLKAELKKPLYFAFSYDEEVGCLGGWDLARSIKETYQETPQYAIIGEPSLMIPTVGQKGIGIFQTTVHGSAGHSSMIRTEVSSVHECARLILWLENKMNELVEAGHVDDRFIPNHTSIHSGIINGGIAPNVIADHCSFTWDVRNIPQDDVIDIKKDFDVFVQERETILRKRFPAAKIVTVEHHPPVPALDTPEHLSIVEMVRELSGNDELGTVSFAAEAGQFALEGFESIICGPGSIAQAHRADEFIAKDELDKGIAFIQKLIMKLS